jgi:hypothetical protein
MNIVVTWWPLRCTPMCGVRTVDKLFLTFLIDCA